MTSSQTKTRPQLEVLYNPLMQNFLRSVSVLFALILVFICYFPGLYGDFEFDDQANLLQNKDIQIDSVNLHSLKLAGLSGDAGPLGRPMSMMTFAINHAYTGFDPFYLKLTNVAIHGVSGIALYALLVQLLVGYKRSYSLQIPDKTLIWSSLLIATAWMLHPLNITSILYIVQRMTSLSGLFSLLALFFYALGRNQTLDGKIKGWGIILIAPPIAGAFALLSKENAGILPLQVLLIEYFFFRFRTHQSYERRILQGIFLLTLWAPLAVLTVFLFHDTGWLLNGYGGRGFTLSERLMTEGRVLGFYLRMIFAPDISMMGIYHDDLPISTGWITPPSTVIAAMGLAILAIMAFLLRHRAPMLAFGITWYFAGHFIESSFIPLEIAHEHRNYLPMIGPLLASIYYLLSSPATAKIRRTAYLLTALLIFILAFSTHVRAKQWGDLLEHAMLEAENHPQSPRAQQQLGRMYFKLYKAERREGFYQKAKQAFTISSSLDPHFKSGLYARIILDYNAGREPPQQVLSDFRHRLLYRRTEPGDVTMFESLLKCQISGDCKLPDNVFIDFLEIETKRYRQDPLREATFFSFLGSYAAQKMNNEILAEKYLKEAVRAYPEDVQSLLNYAWYLAVVGEFSAADNYIAKAWQADKLNKYSQRIYAVERNIREHKNAPN
jgi:hypothetical protein